MSRDDARITRPLRPNCGPSGRTGEGPNDPGPTLSPGGLSTEGLLNDPKKLDQAIKQAKQDLEDANLKLDEANNALAACLTAQRTANNPPPPPHRGNPGGAGFYTRKPQKPSPCADKEAAYQQAFKEWKQALERLQTLEDMKANPDKYRDPRFQ